MKDFLIEIINRSNWWHVPPSNSNAYQERGKFLASTYAQAEFYGRPNMESEKVNIKNPVFGFSEAEILGQLFDKEELATLLTLCAELAKADSSIYEKRITLDAKMYSRAKQLGYDAIVLMTEAGKIALRKSRKPSSIELNILI